MGNWGILVQSEDSLTLAPSKTQIDGHESTRFCKMARRATREEGRSGHVIGVQEVDFGADLLQGTLVLDVRHKVNLGKSWQEIPLLQ